MPNTEKKLLEKDVRDAVIAHAKPYIIGHKRNVFRPGMAAGWPDDTLYFIRGVTLHIEFKAPNKKPTRVQQDKIARLRDAGHFVAIVDHIEYGKYIVEGVCRKVHDLYPRTPRELHTFAQATTGHTPKMTVYQCELINV